ncbi:MAG: hypothetical protein WBL87_04180 [Methanothrix sp.]
MASKAILIAVLFLCLSASVSSQGYMGTISTGTGILEPLTVGKNAISTARVGAISMQENLSGSWALDLKGSESRHFELQVLHEGDLIAGLGQMSSALGSQAVSVAGYVSGNSPIVFLNGIDRAQTFRVKLSHSGSSLSGEYDFISQDAAPESGTATGQMTLLAPTSSSNVLGKGINPGATSGAYVGSATKSIL